MFKADIFAACAVLLRIGGQLLLIPFLLRSVAAAELAAWYSLMSIGAIGSIFDMGVSGAILRYASAYNSGASEIPKEGLLFASTSDVNWTGLNSLYGVASRFYKLAGFICGLTVIILAYYFALPSFVTSAELHYPYLFVFVFTLAIVGGFYSTYSLNIIRGVGRVATANAIVVFTSLSSLVVSFILLCFKVGIMSMPLGQLVGAVLLRVVAARVLRNHGLVRTKEFNSTIFRSMIPNGFRMVVLCLSGFLFAQTGVILSTKYLPLADVAPLGLSNQVATLLATIGSMFLTNRLPGFTACMVSRNYAMLRRRFFFAFFFGIFIYSAGAITVIVLGQFLLRIIGSNTSLLATTLLMMVFFSKLIELVHDQFANLVMAQNRVPFIFQSIIGGILMISGNYLAIKNYGIPGMLVVSIVVLTFVYLPYPMILGFKILLTKSDENS